MRPTDHWRPEGYWEPLIGSDLISADETRLTFLDAYAPDGLLAPGALLGTSHIFFSKIGGQNITTTRWPIIVPIAF